MPLRRLPAGLPLHSRSHRCFGGARSFDGGGEAHPWSDAADAMQAAIGFRDPFEHAFIAAALAIVESCFQASSQSDDVPW